MDAPTLTPYLTVADARAAIAFYGEAFDARPHGEVHEVGDGRIGHAEVAIGEALVYLADEFPEMDLLAPTTRGHVTASLVLRVDDADAAWDRAVAAGATAERAVVDGPDGGRIGWVVDPAGHRWALSGPAR